MYGKTSNVLSTTLDGVQSPKLPISDEKTLLTDDLLNDSAMVTAISILEMYDKITDNEIQNCIMMTTHSFIHPVNYLLSIAALGLSFFNFQLLSLRKFQTDEAFYDRETLPPVTYISFTGIFSEIDIDVVNAFSNNVQTIVLYDSSTGGPTLDKKGAYEVVEDQRTTPRHPHTVSDKLLLIPLNCENSKTKKAYNQNDILTIFENLVARSIAKFKPTYIVLNCSFIFEENNDTPLAIDKETMAQIIHLLSLLCDKKIIIYPFKLPNIQRGDTKKYFDATNQFLKSDLQKERFKTIFTKYSRPYDEKYLAGSIYASFEVLAGNYSNFNNN